MRALAAQAVGDVLRHGQIGKQGIGLKQDAVVAFLRLGMGDVAAGQRDDAAVRRSSPAMARSSVVLPQPEAQQADQLAGADIQRHIGQCGVGAEALDQVAYRQEAAARAGLAAARAEGGVSGDAAAEIESLSCWGMTPPVGEQRQYGSGLLCVYDTSHKGSNKTSNYFGVLAILRNPRSLACTVLVAELKSFMPWPAAEPSQGRRPAGRQPAHGDRPAAPARIALRRRAVPPARARHAAVGRRPQPDADGREAGAAGNRDRFPAARRQRPARRQPGSAPPDRSTSWTRCGGTTSAIRAST